MDKRRLKTRIALQQAYIQATLAHPDRAITVVELCAMADINKTTFYRNFSDLADLYYVTIEGIVELYMGNLDWHLIKTDPRSFLDDVFGNINRLPEDYLRFMFTCQEDCSIIGSRYFFNKARLYMDDLLAVVLQGAMHQFMVHGYHNRPEYVQRFKDMFVTLVDIYAD